MNDASAITTVSGSPGVVTATTASTTNTDSWRYRRRFMFAITGFCMGVIVTALLAAPIASVAEIAIMMGFGTLVAIFGFYVAGATWDDHSIREFQVKGLAALQVGAQAAPAPIAPVSPAQAAAGVPTAPAAGAAEEEAGG